MQLATKLKALREKYGFLQKEVAEAIGVSVPIISNYEKGKKMPSRETLIRLAHFYGISTSELLDEVDSIPSTLPDDLNEFDSFMKNIRIKFMDASEKDRDTIYQTISELYWEAKNKMQDKNN